MAQLSGGVPTKTHEDEKRCWRTDRVVAHLIFARYGAALLDAAATDHAVSLAPFCVTPEIDALASGSWIGRALSELDDPAWRPKCPTTWLNCSWGSGGSGTGAWVTRALEEREARRIGRLLLLVPEATDTAWWWNAANVATVAVSLGRIAYTRPNGERVDSPPQGSTLFVIDPLLPSLGEAVPSSGRVVFEKWDEPRRAQQTARKVERAAVRSSLPCPPELAG